MIIKAKEKNLDIDFFVCDMLKPQFPNNYFTGIILYYSIVHFTMIEVEEVIFNMWNMLEKDGLLFLAFHVGEEVLHIDTLFDEEVNLDYMFFNNDSIVKLLVKHNFRMIEVLTRHPYDQEYNSKKGYIICQKN